MKRVSVNVGLPPGGLEGKTPETASGKMNPRDLTLLMVTLLL
jgi:hypothetical protein